jgi:hypothetical protein
MWIMTDVVTMTILLWAIGRLLLIITLFDGLREEEQHHKYELEDK